MLYYFLLSESILGGLYVETNRPASFFVGFVLVRELNFTLPLR